MRKMRSQNLAMSVCRLVLSKAVVSEPNHIKKSNSAMIVAVAISFRTVQNFRSCFWYFYLINIYVVVNLESKLNYKF